MSTSVVTTCNGPKAFLSCSIPLYRTRPTSKSGFTKLKNHIATAKNQRLTICSLMVFPSCSTVRIFYRMEHFFRKLINKVFQSLFLFCYDAQTHILPKGYPTQVRIQGSDNGKHFYSYLKEGKLLITIIFKILTPLTQVHLQFLSIIKILLLMKQHIRFYSMLFKQKGYKDKKGLVKQEKKVIHERIIKAERERIKFKKVASLTDQLLCH